MYANWLILASMFRNPSAFLSEMMTRNPVLTWVTLGHIVLSLVLIALLVLDHDTMILGINRWIKPLKFAISIAIFTGTMAWLLPDCVPPSSGRLYGWILSVMMIIEMGLITMQAARGVRSHNNIATGFDAAVFGLMGTAIVINTLAMAALMVQVIVTRPMTSIAEAPSYHEAIIWGIGIFLFASYVGFYMAGVAQQPIVGGPVGGPGLPFLNWSLQFGDLRIAHFVGLHALQLIPLLAAFLLSQGITSSTWPRVLGIAFSVLVLLAFLQAKAGRPLGG